MLSPLVLRQNAAIMQLEEITLVDFTFEINVWIVIEKGDTMAVLETGASLWAAYSSKNVHWLPRQLLCMPKENKHSNIESDS